MNNEEIAVESNQACQYRYLDIGTCGQQRKAHRSGSHRYVAAQDVATIKHAAEVLRNAPPLAQGQADGAGDVQELIDRIKAGERIGFNAHQIADGIFSATLRGIIDEATPKVECPCCRKPSIVVPAYGECMNCGVAGCHVDNHCRLAEMCA